MFDALNVLYEDNHLLVVSKPAMLATMGVAPDRPSLLGLAKQYIRQRYQKPGNVYLGIVSRLDAPVTGVVLLARTSKSAARLSKQFREQQVEKTYWALVADRTIPNSGRWIDYVVKDERHRKMRIGRAGAQGALESRLSYSVLDRFAKATLLEVRPETGRKHQIRLQLAHHGWPIIGDRKYGSRREFSLGIALHCRQLRFEHPVRREPMAIVAPLPAAWTAFGLYDPTGPG